MAEEEEDNSADLQQRMDSAMMSMLHHLDGVDKFLDQVYGFLHRRTDFFLYPTNEEPNRGYPAGVAQNLSSRSFSKYQRIEQAKLEEERKKNAPPEPPKPLPPPPSEERDEPPPPKEDERCYMADAEHYNGAVRERYSWSQQIGEIDIYVNVPHEVTNKNDLKVTIEKQHIKVLTRKRGAEKGDEEWVSYIDDDLCWTVRHTMAEWSFEKSSHKLQISLEKWEERWWEAAFEGEEKINVREIDCSRPITELDDEAQSKIAQVKYDEEQKRKGLPTSKEQNIHDILKGAWNLPSSPFRGTDFDPKMFNIQ